MGMRMEVGMCQIAKLDEGERTMPTAPARPEGRPSRMLSAMPWKCMVSCSGYKHPNATNHAMKSPTTMLKSAPLEKRWVAKL